MGAYGLWSGGDDGIYHAFPLGFAGLSYLIVWTISAHANANNVGDGADCGYDIPAAVPALDFKGGAAFYLFVLAWLAETSAVVLIVEMYRG